MLSAVCGGTAPSVSKFGSALSKIWNLGSVAGSVTTHTVSMRIVSTDIVVRPRACQFVTLGLRW